MADPAPGHASPRPAPLASTGRAVNGWAPEYVEAMHAAWTADRSSVDPSWNQFFLGYELGLERPAPAAAGSGTGADPAQSKVDALIEAYRRNGHLGATLDPLGTPRPMPQLLALSAFGLGGGDLTRSFATNGLPIGATATLADIVAFLQRAYCGSIGAEFGHVSCPTRRAWIASRMEDLAARGIADDAAKRRVLDRLVAAEGFENFLATRFIGKKRFGLEGGESLLVVLDRLLGDAAESGASECVMGMAHRGRLNVLHNVAGKPAEMIFTEFDEAWEPHFAAGGGDVKYHQGFTGTYGTAGGKDVRVSLCANPSHLEFVAPVATGRARARQERVARTLDEGRRAVLPVLIHGDAALPGQGVVAETLNMCGLDGYDVGGTVHVVINNQVGFTTDSRDSYAGAYCTNVARIVEAPVFHVNGGDAEACDFVARLAVAWRTEFGEDAFVDMWCWRKNGHNETDEPNFTQPLLYKRIRAAKPVAARWAERLVAEGTIPADGLESRTKALFEVLDAAQQRAKSKPVEPGHAPYAGAWDGIRGEWSDAPVETGVGARTLKGIAAQLATLPEGFNAHKTVAKGIASRAAVDTGTVDWATAELLAYGSLVEEGFTVRVTGQDVKRGTFSHRHAVAFDQETGEQWIALQHLKGAAGRFEIFNSPLTECACVGFEYGYSLVDPKALVIWEAQFGDFVNGAQVILDQWMASAEAKWFRSSGLTLLLPHGYEGQGPEHSSARMERFLQLAAEDRLQVAYPSTTAQVFHVLRRQLRRNFRKPLVVLTPKSMLRLPAAQSPIAELAHGQFQAVIADPAKPDPKRVRRVVLCTGKLYHELDAARNEGAGNPAVALVRIEQLAPFPADDVRAQLDRYPEAAVTWAQEEPENMGAWHFVLARFAELGWRQPSYAGRPAQSSPASGSLKRHGKEQATLVATALGGGADAAKGAGKAKGNAAR